MKLQKVFQRNKKDVIVYVGDSRDVVKRILTNHCKGNVEASALRRYVAEAMGYRIKKARRPSGSIRVRIDVSDPKTGEEDVSNYIRSGEWRYVICSSFQEAHDFQWYAIDQLDPVLNKDRKTWNRRNLHRYQDLLARLSGSPRLKYSQLHGMQSGPGVYVLHHQNPKKEVNKAL